MLTPKISSEHPFNQGGKCISLQLEKPSLFKIIRLETHLIYGAAFYSVSTVILAIKGSILSTKVI